MRHDGYVQFGCGLSAPEGWLNFDASPTLWLQRLPIVGGLCTLGATRFPKNVRFGDVVRGLPIASGSCKAVYSSHVLEHLAFEDARRAIGETFRCLEPGGVFRFVLPDLELFAREYLAKMHPRPAVTFMDCLQMGERTRSRGFGELLRGWLGNRKHLWMWDYDALAEELAQAGFVDVRRAEMGDHPDPRFAEIEELSRWEGFLGMQAHKPS
jgi:SAM-dependent methyltransferase